MLHYEWLWCMFVHSECFYSGLFVRQDFDILASHYPLNTQMVYILSLGVVKEYRKHGIGA